MMDERNRKLYNRMSESDRMLFDIMEAWPHLSPWKQFQIYALIEWEIIKQDARKVIQWALSFPEWLLNKIGIR